MGVFICKQPNGLYCRFSTVVDCPTHWNMTEEDFINHMKEEAEEEARYILENRLRPFDMVAENFRPYNMTQEEFNKFLNETKGE